MYDLNYYFIVYFMLIRIISILLRFYSVSSGILNALFYLNLSIWMCKCITVISILQNGGLYFIQINLVYNHYYYYFLLQESS